MAGAWWGIGSEGVEMRDGYKMFNARLAPSPCTCGWGRSNMKVVKDRQHYWARRD